MGAQTVLIRRRLWKRLQTRAIQVFQWMMNNNVPITPAIWLRAAWRYTGVDQVAFGGIGGTGGQGLHFADPRVTFWLFHPSGVGLHIIYWLFGNFMADGNARGVRFFEGFSHDDTPGGDRKWAQPNTQYGNFMARIAAMLGCNLVYTYTIFDQHLGRHSHMMRLTLSRVWHRTNRIIVPGGFVSDCVMNPLNFLLRLAGWAVTGGATRNPSTWFVRHLMNAPRFCRLMVLRGFLWGDGCDRERIQDLFGQWFIENAPAGGHVPALPAVPATPLDLRFYQAVQSNDHLPILRLMRRIAVGLGFRCTTIFRLFGDAAAWAIVVENSRGLLNS